jgi:hypothetical protein
MVMATTTVVGVEEEVREMAEDLLFLCCNYGSQVASFVVDNMIS